MHPIRDRIRDLIFLETHPLPKFKRPALTLLRFAYHIIAKAWQDAVARRAAALSFFTVLYLLPLSVLVLFGLSRSPLFRDQMADVRGFLVDQLVTPAAKELVQDLFSTLSRKLDLMGTGVAGMLAVIVLLLLGTSLLSMVQRAINRIWRVPRAGGSALTRIAMLWAGVTLLPLLLAFSFTLTTRPGVRGFLEGLPHGIMAYGLPFLLTVACFWFLYAWVPGTRVKPLPSFIAALFAAACWEAAKVGLSLYVIMVISRSPIPRLYGSLALVPIGLLWIYYTWLIVLLGAELAYVLQNLGPLHLDALARWEADRGTSPLTARIALAILWEILDTYRGGRGAADLSAITARYHLHPREIDTWVTALKEKEILLGTVGGGIAPARPTEGILTGEALRIYRESFRVAADEFPPACGAWLFEDLRRLERTHGDAPVQDLFQEA